MSRFQIIKQFLHALSFFLVGSQFVFSGRIPAPCTHFLLIPFIFIADNLYNVQDVWFTAWFCLRLKCGIRNKCLTRSHTWGRWSFLDIARSLTAFVASNIAVKFEKYEWHCHMRYAMCMLPNFVPLHLSDALSNYNVLFYGVWPKKWAKKRLHSFLIHFTSMLLFLFPIIY